MDIQALLDALGYLRSGGRHWVTPESADPRLAHHYRLAKKAGEFSDDREGAEVIGSYVYQTSLDNKLTPPRPAVFVARARNEEQAREIHKRLWNLGDCPFVIIVLSGSIRVYAGFRCDPDNPDKALIGNPTSAESDTLFDELPDSLKPFQADAIDSGDIWRQQAKYLGADTRVDYRLLNSLKELSARLHDQNGPYRLNRKVAHALIGKYIYFRYLRDRAILDDAWLMERGIRPEDVFGRDATSDGFATLGAELQIRFNGVIFPFPKEDDEHWRTNGAIPFLAGIFHGDTPAGQLALDIDFRVYDFSYIPVELLSSIYEQFLKAVGGGQGDGVVYTPEALADYVLAEMEAVHPLRLGQTVLDPCCGSGVFLVLAYRRLIEMLWRKQGACPSANAMKHLLQTSIFGVEKDEDACNITAFSLLLTLLSHLEPPELNANAEFQFPTLVGENIYQSDFFATACPVFKRNLRFDWIVGNPPWAGADEKNPSHQDVLTWIRDAEKHGRKVGNHRMDEAFTWRVADVLNNGGCAGLLIKATSLVNSSSAAYRKGFFTSQHVHRITNFSNLRRILFMGPEGNRTEAPAECIIYTNMQLGASKESILHFGPFVVNQIPVRSKSGQRRVWTIALYESDIQQIDYEDAVHDVACLWKTALWGSYQDRQILRHLNRLLPMTLGEIFAEPRLVSKGPHVKPLERSSKRKKSKGTFIPAAELKDQRILDTQLLKTRFLVTDDATPLLEPSRWYIEKREGSKGLQLIPHPHILVTAEIAIYSDRSFVIPAPKVGIASPLKDDADLLKATALYLNSSVARYAHFFQSALWGIYIGTVNRENVEAIPFPKLLPKQVAKLASAYEGFAKQESDYLALEVEPNGPKLNLQQQVDDVVEAILGVPESISLTAREFMQVRYQLLEGKTGDSANRPPDDETLTQYGEDLRDQLDDFARRYHQITILTGSESIIATVEVTLEPQTLPVNVSPQRNDAGRDILKAVQERHSQWAYIQRSVRHFDGPRVHIIKAARLLDWTRTQAIQDASDLISEVLDRTQSHYEPAIA